MEGEAKEKLKGDCVYCKQRLHGSEGEFSFLFIDSKILKRH